MLQLVLQCTSVYYCSTVVRCTVVLWCTTVVLWCTMVYYCLLQYIKICPKAYAIVTSAYFGLLRLTSAYFSNLTVVLLRFTIVQLQYYFGIALVLLSLLTIESFRGKLLYQTFRYPPTFLQYFLKHCGTPQPHQELTEVQHKYSKSVTEVCPQKTGTELSFRDPQKTILLQA